MEYSFVDRPFFDFVVLEYSVVDDNLVSFVVDDFVLHMKLMMVVGDVAVEVVELVGDVVEQEAVDDDLVVVHDTAVAVVDNGVDLVVVVHDIVEAEEHYCHDVVESHLDEGLDSDPN